MHDSPNARRPLRADDLATLGDSIPSEIDPDFKLDDGGMRAGNEATIARLEAEAAEHNAAVQSFCDAYEPMDGGFVWPCQWPEEL